MGWIITEDGLRLHYEEFGTGDRAVLSAQAGLFYPKGIHQALAGRGYHVYCLTLRGFFPSDYVTEDYGGEWYDRFAADVICLADRLGLDQFFYMGASHGAGVGWHLLWKHAERIRTFIAMVPGPHSLEEGVMSYRQMLMQGLIDAPPPFDPPIDHDPERKSRRRERQAWLDSLPEPDEREKRIDYGRPLMSCGTEKRLREVLSAMQTPTLILGGMEDPISTPELMLRTAGCLPHCKLVMYSNCGHNLDTEMPEELAEEADRFLKRYSGCGRSRKTMTGI